MGCNKETSDYEQDIYVQPGTFTSTVETMFGISLYCLSKYQAITSKAGR